MARWFRFFGSFITVAGIISFALAQDPANGQAQQPGQPPVQAGDAQPAAPPAPDADLSAQVQQLRSDVDTLKDQVAQLNSLIQQLQAVQATPAPAPAPAAPKATPTPAKSAAAAKGKPSNGAKKSTPAAAAPVAVQGEEQTPLTVLVFHDGHRIEARNYAIVGQTLWVYTEDDSKKMPLSELDVVATKNANSDRGIVFQLPPTK